MEELIEQIRKKFREQTNIIESQKTTVSVAEGSVKTLKVQNAQLRGQVLELQSRLKRVRELMKEVEEK